MTHFFTPEEASKLLPEVRAVVAQIVDLKQRIGSSIGKERNELVDELGILISKLGDLEVELKEIETGLIDFPALRFNEPVYLCWKLGEEEVLYWHGIREGFRGRKLLKPEPAQIR